MKKIKIVFTYFLKSVGWMRLVQDGDQMLNNLFDDELSILTIYREFYDQMSDS
jgi:hypothetical protein